MRTLLLHWAARLYPAQWRARYGEEFHGLLDDRAPIWHDVLDVAKGSLQMRLRHSVVPLVVIGGIVGMCVAGVVARTLPKRFVAHGLVSIRSRRPPSWAFGPPSPAITTTLSSDDLRSILDAHHLFLLSGTQREKRLRDSLRIERVSNNAAKVSFAYPNAATAQRVTWDLEIMIANNTRSRTAASSSRADPSIVIYESPNVPTKAEPLNYFAIVAIGLLGGAMLGALTAFVWLARISV